MKPRNDRILDDLISGDDREAAYRLARDGRLADVAELLAGLERHVGSEQGREALVHFAWMLVETREPQGSDAVRRRDHLAAEIAIQQRNELLKSGSGRAARRALRRRPAR